MPDDPLDVRVIGFDELADGTRELVERIEARAQLDLAQVAGRKAGQARAVVPRVTGALAGSLLGEAAPEIGGAIAGMGDASTPYAGWIEYGGTRGRPYLPEGRYLLPVALSAGAEVQRTAYVSTDREVRGFRWKKPKQ